MGIYITDRPSKTLSNGYLSKWSSSELPLQYELESDYFPINTVDTSYTITNLVYNSALLGTVLTLSVASPYIPLETITIDGTNTSLDGNVFTVKSFNGNDVVIDFYTTETATTGTTIKYYNNYKGLLKVFVGAPDQHPYNLDGSKPIIEAGTIEVNFKNDGTNNVGVSNVNGYVKAGINAMFDTDENSHYNWGSYYVEYAESYDVSDGVNVTNETKPFVLDEQTNCAAFTGFLNPSFDDGLDDWDQETAPIGLSSLWVAGVGEIESTTTNEISTNVINQSLDIRNNIPYSIVLSYDLVSAVLTDYPQVIIWGYDGVKWDFLQREFIDSLGVGSSNIDITTSKNYEKLGLTFAYFNGTTSNVFNIKLQSFQVSTSVVQPCLFTQFANYGVKQFQDSLGGNFGDYVLSPVNTLTPKILTHFEEKTFFKGKPFYFSAIIPESTFSISEGGDSVFLKIDLYKGTTLLSSVNYKVDNRGEGVYTVDPSSVIDANCSWDNGKAQFIIIPSNTFLDATNGTFENPDTATWNISSLNALGAGFNSNSQFARTGLYSGNLAISGPSIPQGENELYRFDSEIPTIIGLDYVFNGYYYNYSNFAPIYSDKLSVYFKVEGTNITTNKILLSNSNITNQWESLTLTFTATNTTHRVIMCVESTELLGAGGATLLFDDLTFKGPIDYISESKPLKNSCDCNQYGGTLRWLNDLGGWESWYFNRQKTEKETVTKKIDIIRDINADWDNTFINGETEKDTIKVFSNKTVLLRSQLLTKNELIQLETIKRSVKVQMLMESGKFQTVTIKPNTFSLIDESQDIQEMTIEVILPNTQIQKQ